MTVEVFSVEQNTPQWDELRRGIVTASEFATVLAQGRKKGEPSVTRRRYMMRLAAERLGAAPAESYSNAHMERGHLLEAEALDTYAMLTGESPELVGFIRNGDAGCSPDALVGGGLVEIKTKLPHLQVEVLLAQSLPKEHVAQVQGQMWVAEREFVDFVCFWPGLPLFTTRVARDEAYIKNLASEVDRFNDELTQTVETIRRYGGETPAKSRVHEQLEQSVNILSGG